jgi:hypothetical protein
VPESEPASRRSEAFRLAVRRYRAQLWRDRRATVPALLLTGLGSTLSWFCPPLVVAAVLERFAEGELADLAIGRVLALARAGSPFVQRALSFDRATRTVVFEAPSGAPIGEAVQAAASAPDPLRLLKRLARAATAIHEAGGVHGAISATTVVIADPWIPTLLASGLPPPVAGSRPADDVAAIIDVVATACGDPAWAATLRGATATTGLELYTWADEIEAVTLRRRAAIGAQLP